jgi:hypothetical protein
MQFGGLTVTALKFAVGIKPLPIARNGLHMPQNTFRRGYYAAWQWIRGNEAPPAVPAYSADTGEPYQAGVARAIRDAHSITSETEATASWLDRALRRSFGLESL